MSSAFSHIIGHETQVEYLQKLIDGNGRQHAFCFTGPQGVGKTAVAEAFAAAMLGVSLEELHQNPEVMRIGIEMDEKKKVPKMKISVEQIRKLNERFCATSFSKTRKIAIIEPAEVMSNSAQNALLKTLEEPSGDALIILITSKEDDLYPTIRSRASVISFGLVARETICHALKLKGASESDAHMTAGISAGRPGVALTAWQDRAATEARVREAWQFFHADLPERFRMAEAVAKSGREEMRETLKLWRIVAHDCLLGAAGNEHLMSAGFLMNDTASTLDDPKKWARVLDQLVTSDEAIQKNTNPLLALGEVALTI